MVILNSVFVKLVKKDLLEINNMSRSLNLSVKWLLHLCKYFNETDKTAPVSIYKLRK